MKYTVNNLVVFLFYILFDKFRTGSAARKKIRLKEGNAKCRHVKKLKM
jgi:hypothetical protein